MAKKPAPSRKVAPNKASTPKPGPGNAKAAPNKAKAAIPASRRRGRESLTGNPGRTASRMLGRVPDGPWNRWKAASRKSKISFSEWARKALDYAAKNPAVVLGPVATTA